MKRWLLLLLLLVPLAFANTPGQVTVTLTWNASPTAGVTYNVYRGSATGVCSGIPTPIKTGLSVLTFIDTNVTSGQTYVYAVTAVKGGESACSNEAQVTVPTIPAPPSSLQATSP